MRGVAVLLIVVGVLHTPSTSAHGDALEEVVVTATRTERSLDKSPLRVQVLGEEELREKANMKPGDIRMMLNESTGIQVQQTSATSFNSSIRIQGLDGRYTQLLRDGLPIYSGFSGSLSLLQIAPLDLQQVEVVKGASSTLYGGGAIAGLVNLVSKTPGEAPESALMLNLTSSEGLDLSAFHSQQQGKHGVTLFGSYNRSNAYEAEKNGLTAIPEFERFTFTPRWFYSVSDSTQFDFGVGYIDETRLGGSVDYLAGRAPDEYFESNDSQRAFTRFELSHEFNHDLRLTFKNANSWFDRRLAIPDSLFSGAQISTFTELAVNGVRAQSNWVLGINGITEKFEQDQITADFDYDYSESTVGVFGQYTRDVSDSVIVEAGLRVDSHSDYGSFTLPRVSVLFLPTPDVTLRLGAGYGYKAPSLFVSEADEIQFRDLTPINPVQFKGETSKGVNFDINHRLEFSEHASLSSNLLLFYTQIDDSVQITKQGGLNVFTQLDEPITTQGAELNLAFSYGGLRYFIGYTYVDSKQETANGDIDLALVSRHRFNNVLVWEKEDNFRIGLEAYYFSKQRRNNDTTGESYWIFGLMTEKKIGRSTTAFLNFENFTDTRQTEFENINRTDLFNPDFRDIYAPLDGFVVNGGFRIEW